MPAAHPNLENHPKETTREIQGNQQEGDRPVQKATYIRGGLLRVLVEETEMEGERWKLLWDRPLHSRDLVQPYHISHAPKPQSSFATGTSDQLWVARTREPLQISSGC